MYTGIRLDGLSVDSYATALKALETRATKSRKFSMADVRPGGA